MTGDWRADLAAARVPQTPEQRAWDPHWCRWFDTARRQGRSPNQAIPIAYRRTEDQYGPRPEQGDQT